MWDLYFPVLIQFCFSVVAQIISWRILRQANDTVRHQILILLSLYIFLPVVGFTVWGNFDQLVLALGLGCAYVMSFPAASAQSPTLLIIDLLSRNPNISQLELEQLLNKKTALIGDRLADLRADGLIETGSSHFRPSVVGRCLGYIFWTYRRILGLPLGEG